MDIYNEATERIIAQMEKGIIPWQKPWVAGETAVAISHTTGKLYSFPSLLLVLLAVQIFALSPGNLALLLALF